MGLAVLPLMSLKQIEPPRVTVAARPLRPMPTRPVFDELVYPGAEPGLVPTPMRVKVTACSPVDSAVDIAYYKKHGYAGSAYNIAANHFPKGTLIRVPGYMEKSYPGQFWEVDSRGGSVIRRSAERGVIQIDVKFKTLYSVKQWGVRWLTVDVITPAAMAAYERDHAAWQRRYDVWEAAKRAQDTALAAWAADVEKWREEVRRGHIDDVPVL
jgi:hypothetical protein